METIVMNQGMLVSGIILAAKADSHFYGNSSWVS